jgi:uracil-DNA glycosylase
MISAFFHALSGALSKGQIITHRSDDELSYLRQWLTTGFREQSAPAEPMAHEVDQLKVREIIQKCVRCTGAGEKKLPFGSGSNGIMIVLNLPDKISTVDMRQYKAEANELMKKMMSAIGVSIEECYITSLIKCAGQTFARPSEMFQECIDLLRAEIAEVQPSMIIVMGAFAPLMRESRERASIRWFNTDHPVTLIKNPDLKRAAWSTLQLIKSHRERNEV